jgi:hypothetical protein
MFGSGFSPGSASKQLTGKKCCTRPSEAAYRRALELGKEENHSYKNSKGETVFWKFAGLANLEMLSDDKISDGTGIATRLRRGKFATKRQLTVFWAERNQKKPAHELLNRVTKSSASR